MLFDDLLGDIESETESAVIVTDGSSLEASKNSRQIFHWNTDAAILHDQHRLAVVNSQLDVDRLSRAVFDSVRNDVADRFVKPEPVQICADCVCDFQTKLATRVRRVLGESLGDFLDHAAQVGGGQIQRQSAAGQL